MEHGKTIKELADELGVSKTAIRKYMTPEFREVYVQTVAGNHLLINEEGCKLLVESFRKPPQTAANQLPETTENPGLREEVAFLRAQLEAKDRQLDAKDRQLEQKDKQLEARDAQIASLTLALENTTASLQAAQALHAGTMQAQLDAGSDPGSDIEEIVPEEDPAPAAEQAPRRGFLARLFGW